MSRIFAFTLGTLTAIGGFLDIGDLVADAQVGARFGLRLAWVTVIATIASSASRRWRAASRRARRSCR